MLRIISRARDSDVHCRHRDGTTSIKRLRLSPAEAHRWEAVLGAELWKQAPLGSVSMGACLSALQIH